MLKSLFSSSLRGLSHFNAPHLIQRQAFASAAKTKAAAKKKVETQPRKEVDPNVFVDPKLENLAKYVDKLDFATASRVYKDCDFEKDMVPALNVYQKLEFNAQQLKYLFRRKPALLRLARPVDKNDIVQFSEFAEKKWGMNKHQIRSVILRDPIMLKKSNEEIAAKTQLLQDKLKLTDKEVKRLMIIYPKVFELSEEAIDKVIQVTTDYTEIPARTLGIIAARFPFYLDISPKNLLGCFKVFQNFRFTNQQIIAIMKRHPEVFAIPHNTLRHTFRLPVRMRLSPPVIARIYTANPRLMTVCPYTIMPKKFKLLKSQLPKLPRAIGNMFIKHPRLFIKSQGSNSLKIRYLKQKMKIETLRNDPAYPAILNYSYASVIRPRGELMLRKDKILAWKDILNLTDQEFADKMESTVEELNTVKAEYKEINNELDYQVRFFSKYFSNRGARAKY